MMNPGHGHSGSARRVRRSALIGLIISVGLEHAPRRTIILIGRMALMMLMMVAMGIMMMWMMGMLPDF